jgi:hypothetical protein
VAQFPEATLVALPDYFSPPWADVITDRTDAMRGAILDFLASYDRRHGTTQVTLPEGAGEVAGIPYRIQGMGPPLVLFPLGLAPPQWAPLLSRLSAQYCTIRLGGPALGFLALLESRGRAVGYQGMVRQLLETPQLQPGEGVLDVGCGSGVLDRWLAQYTGGANCTPLSAEEGQEWQGGVEHAEAEGTFLIAQPFHGAVGTKPSDA